MSFPSLSVLVALASNPFDTSLTYTEIGPASGDGPGGAGWVRAIKTTQGRERLLRSMSQFQAGTATIDLDNRDRRFDPTNSSGPYWPNIQPEKVILVAAEWDHSSYPLWAGTVDDWPQSWPGIQEGAVALVATDLFKSLAIKRMLSAGYPDQILADSPRIYLRCGDPLGAALALDSTGNTMGGIPIGNVTFGEPGAIPANVCSSVLLSPASGTQSWGRIELPDLGFSSSPPGMSFECWMQWPDPGTFVLGISGPMPYAPAGVGGSGAVGLGVDTLGRPFLAVQATDADLLINFTDDYPFADGFWHHLVGTISFTGAGVNLYCDGALVASGTTSPASWTGPATNFAVGVFAGFTVGELGDGGVQEAAIYDYLLTADQVQQHYLLGTFPAQYSGQMVDQVLDTVGIPARLRAIDTGYTWCQPDNQDETQTKVLDQLQKLEQTEQGQCFCDGSGILNFQDRYYRGRYPECLPVATWGDGGAAYPSELPYVMGGVVLNFDRAELYNEIPVTRRNGNQQSAINQTSIDEFTDRTMNGLSDLMMDTDTDALYCGQWIVVDTAFPQYRVGDLVINPLADDRIWPVLLAAQIGTVFTVNKHNIPGGGPPVSLVVRVEGIEHQIDPPRGWTTTLHLSLVDAEPWGIYNDSVQGIWNSGCRYGW